MHDVYNMSHDLRSAEQGAENYMHIVLLQYYVLFFQHPTDHTIDDSRNWYFFWRLTF